MKNKLLLGIALLACNISQAQTLFENKTWGFSMQAPKNWTASNPDEIKENVKQFKIARTQKDRIDASLKSSFLVGAFYKYPIHSVIGFIPTILINARKIPTTQQADFLAYMEAAIKKMETLFLDFKYTQKPIRKTLHGKDAVYMALEYSLKAETGDVYTIRTTAYAVPIGKYYIQISMMDEAKQEDCQALYQQLLQTIHIQ